MSTYVLLTKEYPFPQQQIIYFYVFKLSQLDTQVIHRLVSVFNPYLDHPLIPFSRCSRNYIGTYNFHNSESFHRRHFPI